MKIKRILAALLCALMLANTAVFGAAAAEGDSLLTSVYAGTSGSAIDYFIPVAESVESFETVELPCYIGDVSIESEITVGILNGMAEIPYLSISTLAALLEDTYLVYGGFDETYSVDFGPVDDNNTIFVLVRENDATMIVDLNSGLVTFTDIALFTSDPGVANSLDIVSSTYEGGITITRDSVFYRAGDATVVDLMHYGILPVLHEGEGYLPLQTIADLLYSRIGLMLLYDGVEVMVTGSIEYPYVDDFSLFGDFYDDEEFADDELLFEEDEEFADEELLLEEDGEFADDDLLFMEDGDAEPTLSDLYYAAPKGEKSEALTTFTYNELCLALDYNYGLQAEHGISSFNEMFQQSGLSEKLHSTDAGDIYAALITLCSSYFGDMHSAVSSISYMTELDPYSSELELAQFVSDVSVYANMLLYSAARDNYYPEGPVGYEEVGNTAYITFDEFVFDPDRDYYNTEITNNAYDTVELLIYANEQIKRPGSPVKNVVVDLSNNGGGMADAAVCVLSWMLNSATVNIVDTISGAQSSCVYQFDANLDGSCDSFGSDGLPYIGINLYCVISPNSFSCGNLVPYMLKSSGRVTLIGRSSAGGACVVRTLSTADGNIFQISGPMRISTVRNGSYYSVDTGVEPDVYIANMNHLYDRVYMTEFINDLP